MIEYLNQRNTVNIKHLDMNKKKYNFCCQHILNWDNDLENLIGKGPITSPYKAAPVNLISCTVRMLSTHIYRNKTETKSSQLFVEYKTHKLQSMLQKHIQTLVLVGTTQHTTTQNNTFFQSSRTCKEASFKHGNVLGHVHLTRLSTSCEIQ